MDENGHITLDTNMIGGVPLNDLPPEEIKKLLHQEGQQAAREIEEDDATLTLGALGGSYQVGPIDLNIALGSIVLLHEINSPFVTGDIGEEGDPLDSTECVKALYVLAHGQKAVQPVMAMKQRIQAVMSLKPMVEKNPELFDKLLDRVERMSEAEARFAEDAMDWYDETFVGYDFQEVVDSMFLAMTDMMKMSGDLPSTEEGKKKA